jgi:hypothetical protein
MVQLLKASLEVQQRQNAIGEELIDVSSLNTKASTSFTSSASADYINRHLLST